MLKETIVVQGYFGQDKKMTREEFINIWVEQAKELRRLDYSQGWLDEVTGIMDKVERKASNEFDRKLTVQAIA